MKELSVRIAIILLFAAAVIIALTMLFSGDDAEPTLNETPDLPYAEVRTEETATLSETTFSETTVLTTETVSVESETSAETYESVVDTYSETETEAPKPETTAPETTRYIVTSRPEYSFDSVSCYIDMENVQQNPELPTGCEVTALTILLRHWGYDADKVDMAQNYLYKSWGNAEFRDGEKYADSFFEYFIGDPFGRGYGCFAPAIVKTANKYISENGGCHRVIDLSGCDSETLYNYVAEGIPVLVWATDGMIPPEYYETWYDSETGERLDWYLNEHCFVLAGFNLDAGTVTMNDPIKGIIDYNMAKFEQRFAEMHRQAVVILPA